MIPSYPRVNKRWHETDQHDIVTISRYTKLFTQNTRVANHYARFMALGLTSLSQDVRLSHRYRLLVHRHRAVNDTQCLAHRWSFTDDHRFTMDDSRLTFHESRITMNYERIRDHRIICSQTVYSLQLTNHRNPNFTIHTRFKINDFWFAIVDLRFTISDFWFHPPIFPMANPVSNEIKNQQWEWTKWNQKWTNDPMREWRYSVIGDMMGQWYIEMNDTTTIWYYDKVDKWMWIMIVEIEWTDEEWTVWNNDSENVIELTGACFSNQTSRGWELIGSVLTLIWTVNLWSYYEICLTGTS